MPIVDQTVRILFDATSFKGEMDKAIKGLTPEVKKLANTFTKGFHITGSTGSDFSSMSSESGKRVEPSSSGKSSFSLPGLGTIIEKTLLAPFAMTFAAMGGIASLGIKSVVGTIVQGIVTGFKDGFVSGIKGAFNYLGKTLISPILNLFGKASVTFKGFADRFTRWLGIETPNSFKKVNEQYQRFATHQQKINQITTQMAAIRGALSNYKAGTGEHNQLLEMIKVLREERKAVRVKGPESEPGFWSKLMGKKSGSEGERGGGLGSMMGGLMGKVSGAFTSILGVASLITSALGPVIDMFKQAFMPLFNELRLAFMDMIPIIMPFVRSLIIPLRDALKQIMPPLKEVLNVLLSALGDAFKTLVPIFADLAKSILPLLIPLIKSFAWVLQVTAKVIGAVVGWIKTIVDWIRKLPILRRFFGESGAETEGTKKTNKIESWMRGGALGFTEEERATLVGNYRMAMGGYFGYNEKERTAGSAKYKSWLEGTIGSRPPTTPSTPAPVSSEKILVEAMKVREQQEKTYNAQALAYQKEMIVFLEAIAKTGKTHEDVVKLTKDTISQKKLSEAKLSPTNISNMGLGELQ